LNTPLTKASSSVLAAITATLVCASATLAAGGTIKGKVTFEGTKPNPVKLDMAAEGKCNNPAHEVFAEKTVVGPKNEIQWAIVYVAKGLEGKTFPTPTTPVVLEQKGCMYTPHVFGVMVNQPIDIINNDEGVLHNIHALPKDNDQFNIGQPVPGDKGKVTQKFAKEEKKIKIKCDVHPWMAAWGYALNHPFYAVSDKDGNFEIKDVPAGEYGLSIGHEKFKAKGKMVTVKDGETATADFVLKAEDDSVEAK
jgi:hypothetical protein